MPTRLVRLVIDAADPAALARFWSAALAWPITVEGPDQVVIEPPEQAPAQAGQLPLVFVPVDGTHVWLREPGTRGPYLDIRGNDDPRTGKLRVHLDVALFPDDDHAAEVERLVDLGGHRTDIGQGDVTWEVLADPEGNETCVLASR